MKWWDESWNPVVGCTKCSLACANCYAEALHTQRHKALLAGKKMPECYREPFSTVRFFPERLEQPLHWRKPRRIFVGNMGDLFHENVMDTGALDQIFAVMARCPQHTFMLCTKRPDNQHKYITSEADLEHMAWHADMSLGESQLKEHAPDWHLPNVWLGTTIWDQHSADRAVPILLNTPAAKRFVSVEPMLGPVNIRGHLMAGIDPGECGNCGKGHGFTRCQNYGGVEKADEGYGCESFKRVNFALDWVICGGETGAKARPMHPDWPRSLRDQCQAAGVPFFFKQWGEWAPEFDDDAREIWISQEGKNWLMMSEQECESSGPIASMFRIGTRRAGRVLDGRTWEEVPA